MPIATAVRVRDDIEIRPSGAATVPIVNDRDQALACISEVARIAAGYPDVQILQVVPTQGAPQTQQTTQTLVVPK